MPVSFSVPVPTLISEPSTPPNVPPSAITPENVVLRLLSPTVSALPPRKTVPAPSIEPAVMPPVVSPDISSVAVTPLRMKRAVPPEALSVNCTSLSVFVVMVALPARCR